jgi:hypothetical protein
MFIPEINQEIILRLPWTFDLYLLPRNEKLMLKAYEQSNKLVHKRTNTLYDMPIRMINKTTWDGNSHIIVGQIPEINRWGIPGIYPEELYTNFTLPKDTILKLKSIRLTCNTKDNPCVTMNINSKELKFKGNIIVTLEDINNADYI